jgi:hypothetical protein
MDYFDGFIYDIYIITKNDSSLFGPQVATSGCDYNCPACIGGLDQCLWTCAIDKYAATGTYNDCKTCTSCAAHPNNWSGCRDSVDCNLCDNKLCLTCTDFSNTADCSSCRENTKDPSTNNDVCECDDTHFLDTDDNICTCS